MVACRAAARAVSPCARRGRRRSSVLGRRRGCRGAVGRSRQQDRVRERGRNRSDRRAEWHGRIHLQARRAAHAVRIDQRRSHPQRVRDLQRASVRAPSRHAAHCLAAARQPQGARRIRDRGDRGRRVRLSHQVAPERGLCHGAAERRVLSGVLLDPAEDLAGLRHGLRHRSGAPRGAGARARQRQGRSHSHAPVRAEGGGPAARRSRCHSRLRQGNVARDGCGPAPQSRRLRGRRLRPAAVDPGHSRHHRGKSRCQHERLSALHGADRQPGADAAGLFLGGHGAAIDARTSRGRCTGQAASRSAIPTGRCGRFQPPAVRWRRLTIAPARC
ncbi:hypothetical protein ABH979_006174 [Bradyrhizobium ottawaense]